MYLCIRGIDFTIGFWNCSDRVICFVFHLITILSKIVSEVLFIFILILDKILLMRNDDVVFSFAGYNVP
jgi:hypothetical protein